MFLRFYISGARPYFHLWNGCGGAFRSKLLPVVTRVNARINTWKKTCLPNPFMLAHTERAEVDSVLGDSMKAEHAAREVERVTLWVGLRWNWTRAEEVKPWS